MSRVGHHQPAYEDLHGQFRASYHLEMISDSARVSAIRGALAETLQEGDVFCEVGCGTGIFALEAARLGARVYAIESDPKMVEIARHNVERAGLEERIDILIGDAQSVRPPEPIDIALCEMMSTWAVEEPVIPTARIVLREWLAPEGQFLPSRIVNLAEIGHYPFDHHGASMPAVMPLFTGVPQPHVLTESRVCRTLDFTTEVDLDLSVDTRFEALAAGRANCVVLRSLVQLGPSTVFSGSDSLMPPTVVPLDQELDLWPGDLLRLQTDLRARSSFEISTFSLQRTA